MATRSKADKTTGKRGGRGRVWMLMAQPHDVECLRERFARKGPLWDQWEYKLLGGRIIIYDPVTPWGAAANGPDPSRRYLAMHLRIVPSQPGPFQLEYRRHTGQW